MTDEQPDLETLLDAAEKALGDMLTVLPASHVHFTSGPCALCNAGKVLEQAQKAKAQIAARKAAGGE